MPSLKLFHGFEAKMRKENKLVSIKVWEEVEERVI